MDTSKTTIGIVAAACIAIGAAGTYIAVRPQPSVTDQAPAATPDSSLSAVEQSETVIASTPATTNVETSGSQASSGRALETSRPTPAAERKPRTATPVSTRREAPAANPGAQVPESVRSSTPEPPTPSSVTYEPQAPVASAPVVAEEAPQAHFEDLVVSADSVLGLQMETSLSSERARVEDAVVARVTRDVRVADRVAIPAGSKAQGEVTLVERGGKVRERARLGIRFTSVVLADGTRVPLDTETIYREGDGPGGESAAKIGGGAIGGAILGGIFGGAKGAVLGGTAGAGAGTAAVMAGGRNPATLQTGTPLTVRLVKPATVTVEAP